MSKISKISQLIRILIIFVAFIHLSSFCLALYLHKDNVALTSHIDKTITHEQSGANFYLTAQLTDNWHSFAQNLEQEKFNSLAILASVDVILYLLLYGYIFRLFTLYHQGKFFDDSNIHCIKNIGKCLLAWVAISLFYPIIVNFTIRMIGASHSLPLVFGIGSNEFSHLLSGLIIYAIAWVMAEAKRLQQEQELVI